MSFSNSRPVLSPSSALPIRKSASLRLTTMPAVRVLPSITRQITSPSTLPPSTILFETPVRSSPSMLSAATISSYPIPQSETSLSMRAKAMTPSNPPIIIPSFTAASATTSSSLPPHIRPSFPAPATTPSLQSVPISLTIIPTATAMTSSPITPSAPKSNCITSPSAAPPSTAMMSFSGSATALSP